VDNLGPTVVTQDIIVQLDANGQATITANDVDNGSSDNCGIATSSLDITTFDCSDIGANTVTLIITDSNGNTNSATATVTVVEDVNPVAVTQDITVELDANGQATITANDVDNGSSDNCGISNLSLDITAFDCTNLGDNTVTLTVEDASGNFSTATATVTVVDNLAPTVVTQDISVQLDANGQATITASDVDNGSTDNCGISTYSLDITTFDCSDIGANTITLTITDSNGNTNSATATVTVLEDVNPVAVTQDITVELDANGQATITANDINNGSSDNCGVSNLSLDNTAFDCTNLGDNVVTLTLEDASGNSSTATAIVTVVDNLDPTAIAQDIIVELDANGQATITISDLDNGSSDNCGVSNQSLDITTFDCTNIGDNVVTLTVEDASGNSSTATATVTVVDNSGPTVVTQDITVQLDPNGQVTIAASDVDNGSSDNCSIVSTSLDITSFDCSNVGTNIVTLTITDSNGNTNSATATVTVFEDVNPVAVAQDITVELDANGQAFISAGMLNNGSSDNCNITNIYLDNSTFDCTDVGDNLVVFTVADGSGNTDSVAVTVTVQDILPPTALGQDIIVDLAGNPSVSITPEDVNNGSFDNCSDVTLSIDVDTFTTIGDYPVVLTVTDVYGNPSTVTVTVTVIDTLNIRDFDGENIFVELFPNPTTGEINIESNIEILSFSIIDINGKIVLKGNSSQNIISLNALADGVYLIKLNTENGSQVIRKVIKKSH
jgi:hypothetical protein